MSRRTTKQRRAAHRRNDSVLSARIDRVAFDYSRGGRFVSVVGLDIAGVMWRDAARLGWVPEPNHFWMAAP